MSKFKKLLIASLSIALAAAIAVPVTGAIVKASNTPIWSDVEFSSEYIVDQTVNIPERTLSIAGENYPSTITLTYPDGSKSSFKGGELKLSMAGQYEVTYSKGINKVTEKFFVVDKLWSVQSNKSSVEYGTVGQTDALLVRLAKNDTLTFNKIIDLADYDAAEDILFRGFINPDTIGSNDFSQLIIKFTDVYDPTQVLTFRASKSTSSVHVNYVSYWTAAGANQTLGGIEADTYRQSGSRDDGICGLPRSVSFCGQSGKWTPGAYELIGEGADAEFFKLVFDQNTKVASVQDRTNTQMVVDLDNPLYYPSEPLWDGFTSGKVIVSVTANNYVAETANFAISDLFSYDLSSENKFIEQDAPEITVDVDDKYVDYSSDGTGYFKPVAIYGGNYPVPTATAFDGYSGNVKVTTKVYANYTDAQNTSPVAIEKDGTFKVESIGTYAIVYTAKDNMGNEAQRIYWITSVASIANPLALSIDTTSVAKDGVCGVKIPLAPYATVGGSGDVTVKITATCGDVELDVTSGELIAEKAGTWTINYLAKDYSGIIKEASYEIDIEWGSEPVFLGTPTLPRYFISGMEYTVPTVYAYDYSTGKKIEKTASLVVTDKNGTNTYAAGENYTPEVDSTGKLEMAFKCDNVIIPLDVAAVNPLVEMEGIKALKIENMFIGEGFDKVTNKDGLTLTATADEDFSWLFANSIAAEGASVKVKGVKGYSAFDAFEVTMTDYADSSISVTIRIRQSLSGNAYIDFGGMDRKLTKGLNMGTDDKGTALDEFTFSYKLGQFYVDNIGVSVATTDDGNEFNGFPSNKVYISAKAVGVTAGQKYLVKQIDNHIVKNNVYDTTAPKIAINGTYGGMHSYKAEYVVTSAVASDVIDPNVPCTVTVKLPNGAIAEDINGVRLDGLSATEDYTIKLTEYGQYQVTYNSKDWAGKKAEKTYTINVFDRKAPKATITGSYVETAKVGDTVILPEVEISDDSSAVSDMKVYRTVRTPFASLTVIGYDIEGAQYSFTFKNEGDYDFIIIVYDEAGNQTMLSYTVTVTKGE